MNRLPAQFQVDPFWGTYKETLDSLRALGKKFPLKTRLPIFKLYRELSLRAPTQEVEIAMWKLTELREIMARGLEPKHRNGKYI